MKIVAMVLAGGNGTRLRPLTEEHAKPALSFAGGYRIVDFVLSNLVNSNISSIYLLAHYKPHSLITHIRTAWARWSQGRQPAISIVLPETSSDDTMPNGTAVAVYRNLHLIERDRPDLVAIFAADHIYRMDVRQMVRFHQERGAEVSIAAVPVPIEIAAEFGIMTTGAADEVLDFQEKPKRPTPIETDPGRAYASMGNYLFDPGILIDLLKQARRRGDTDFGHHILPKLPHSHRVFAYDFSRNTVPGVRPQEERGYWRDIGTLDAYRAAQRDVLGPLPRFELSNGKWPIRGDVGWARERLARPDLVSSTAPSNVRNVASAKPMSSSS
jgi:glucose-1-phosphate adenylyltransferase